ncbi:MAG TPA: DUF2283 domain-containing protein [bacterium]|nr:DUF2283 domain-containing protein [bacterium]
MKISFDEKADALYIQFQEKNELVKETLKIQDGIMVDIGEGGKIFGIEILEATSRRIPIESLGHVNIDLPVKAAG